MSNFDRILNTVGTLASGALVAAESGQLPLPWWAKAALAIIIPVAMGSASPMVKRSSLKTPKPDARGQVRDDEDPK